MQSRPSRWECAPYEVALAERLAAGGGVSAPIGTILARRGFRSVAEARSFLRADARHDPLTLPGAEEACTLVLEHLRRGSRIAVFGDYDVDGVCSTAMLVRTLRMLGADPIWELPSRFDDGYGLSPAAVERLAARGAALLITVDCGITAVEPVAAARAAGLDVLVTDHHRPGEDLPDCAIVHPGLGGYGCPELCAAGVVLKLSEALMAAAGRDPRGADDALDLAGLATVCDLVPLRDENRRIARAGLLAVSRTRRPGLRALMEVAGVEPAEVSEHSLGFRLGPRINAAGRMGRADAALELLLTEDAGRAAEVARELDLLNRDRREAETRILFQAEAAALAQGAGGAIVVAGEGWHPGVVGIVASRLVERWRRPCVVIALEEGRGRGSGRSVQGYDLHAGLAACAQHLMRFGGHRMAAGLELDAEWVEPFRRALADHAGAALSPDDLIPREHVDAIVPGGMLGLELADDLEALRPFGIGNPQPTLLVPAARFEHVTGMGEEREHSRFTLVTAGGAKSRGVAFRSPPGTLEPARAELHDIALRLERNRWRGVVEPRVLLRALCPTTRGRLSVLEPDQPFWEALGRAVAAAIGDGTRRAPPMGAFPAPVDRRSQGFAGVAGELFTSGERVLVAVADVPRRREGLESHVAGLAQGAMSVVSWAALGERPELAEPFDHLVALDPPPGGCADPLLAAARRTHLAWGPAEVEFALAVARAELDLRPGLTTLYCALRELATDASAHALEAALRGAGRYPRSARMCARLIRVLTELELLEFDVGRRSCAVLSGARTDLERSAAYRSAQAQLTAVERALASELPQRSALPARAA